MEYPRVSVIIPVYNVENYLRQALDSVINQTLKDIEIICVNDGSTDGSLQILQEYAQKDSRIIIIDQKNRGVSAARNCGLDIAKSDYVLFLDSDDMLEPEACEKSLNRILETDVDVVCFGVQNLKNNLIQNHWSRTFLYNLKNPDDVDLRDLKRFLFIVSGKIYKRDFLNKNNIRFNEGLKISEDGVFNFQCLYRGARYNFVRSTLLTYCIREGSATTKKDAIDGAIEAFEYFVNSPDYQNCGNLMMKIIMVEKTINDILYYYNFLKKNEYFYAKERAKYFIQLLKKNIPLDILEQCINWNGLQEIASLKVSIIIPVYNVENYLRRALDSVIKQSLWALEIICVDDCSTDGSVEILREYAQKDSRIKIHIQTENQGQGVARNVALDMATGEYIMFLDPDDWLRPDACELAYNQAKNNGDDIVFFNYNQYKESETTIVIKKSQHLKGIQNDEQGSYCLKDVKNLKFTAATVWAQIYNREFINRINARFSETRTCEDNPFYFNAIANAQTVSIIPEELYYYRVCVGTGQPYYIKHWEDVFFNKKLTYDIVKRSKYAEQLLAAYIPYYWSSLVNGHISRVLKYDKTLKKVIYKELHELAKFLNSEYPMKTLEDRFDYNRYKAFLLTGNLLGNKLSKSLFKTKIKTKTHVVYNVLGIKIKIKRG